MAEEMRPHAEPQRHVIDDITATEMTFNRAASLLGVWPVSVSMWCLNGTLCFLFAWQILSSQAMSPFFGHRFVLGGTCLGIGLLYVVVIAIAVRRIQALTIPTDFTVSDDGFLYTRRGTPTVAVPWNRVLSVKKVDGGFIVAVSPRCAQRMIFVPSPSDESLARAVWATCYEHMVPKRGLRPSAPDRLGTIENTAAA